jgi:hypothetical protein
MTFMQRKFTLILFVFLLSVMAVKAQVTGIVCDKTTNMPIAYASIYSTDDGTFHAVSTDANGRFNIGFKFRKVTFSHLNYNKVVTSAVSDTVFMTPKVNTVGEVVVTNNEPKWINDVLFRFVDTRNEHYQMSAKLMNYAYETNNLGDTCGYSFKSNGTLSIPSIHQMDKDSVYKVSTASNTVFFKDTTAGVDFYPMRQMLYENFVNAMDKKFIHNHIFRENEAYKNADSHVVQLVFWSPKQKDDRGTLVIDTAQCIVLSATRHLGLETNLKEKTNSIVRGLFKAVRGYNYDDWVVDNSIDFQQINGILYPARITYRNYNKWSYNEKKKESKHLFAISSDSPTSSKKDKNSDKSTVQRVTNFSSTESELTLNPCSQIVKSSFIDLEPVVYTAFIVIDTRHKVEMRKALKNVPKKFELYR